METTLTPEQVELIQTIWRKLEPMRERAGELFYSRFFECNPTARHLFKGDMKVQETRLTTMLAYAVDALEHWDSSGAELRRLGKRHREYGVRHADYEGFGEALVWMLQVVLGPELTPDAEESWCAFYKLLTDTMQSRDE